MKIIELSKKKQSKHNRLLDEYIELLKYGIENPEGLPRNIFNEKREIEFLKTLPYGKELDKTFELLTLRIGEQFLNNNEHYKNLVHRDFLFDFYKTLLIGIDKELKLSQDFGFINIKNAFYKSENHKELKKALNNFNCKYQNHYYEFSKNGVIELYAQWEYLRLKNFLKLKEKETELKNFQLNNLRNQLKEGNPNYKLYKEITTKQIVNALNGKKGYLTKIIEPIHKKRELSG